MGIAGALATCLNHKGLTQLIESPGLPGLFFLPAPGLRLTSRDEAHGGALDKERALAENTVRNSVVTLESVLSD